VPTGKRQRRSGRPPRRQFRETTANEADPFWIYIDGRRMFVAGWTSGGAPYGIFEDEMDAGMNFLDADGCDEP
jgi:hypothetical protein